MSELAKFLNLEGIDFDEIELNETQLDLIEEGIETFILSGFQIQKPYELSQFERALYLNVKLKLDGIKQKEMACTIWDVLESPHTTKDIIEDLYRKPEKTEIKTKEMSKEQLFEEETNILLKALKQ